MALELRHCKRHRSVRKHGFSDEDKMIKNLYQLKGYKATEFMSEFPKKWLIKVGC